MIQVMIIIELQNFLNFLFLFNTLTEVYVYE